MRTIAFSPDGRSIVTGGEDRTAKVWEATTGQELLTLKSHINSVWSVAFSLEGNQVVTGIAGQNATAKV